MGWPDASAEDRKAGASLAKTIERIRWRLWHGQVGRGLDLIAETVAMLQTKAETQSPATSAALKVTRLLGDLETWFCQDWRQRNEFRNIIARASTEHNRS